MVIISNRYFTNHRQFSKVELTEKQIIHIFLLGFIAFIGISVYYNFY